VSRLRAFGGARALLWAAPLALVAANVVWLFAFGSGSRVRDRELDRTLARLEREDRQLETRLAAREKLWIAAHDNEESLAELLGGRLSTEEARFTDQVREVKSLAERAGLDPQSIGYPKDVLEQYGLVRRSFVLPVSGSWASLRTFLNLIELTPSFLTVEEIGVSDSDGKVTVRLRLATFFTTGGGATAAGAGS